MPVSYLDSTTTGTTAFAASRAIPVPTGGGALQADDVVVVRLSRWESSNPAVTTPAGTWIHRTQQANGSGKIDTYLKRLTAADSGTYTFSWTGSMWTTGQATAYRGVDPAADLSTIPLHQVTNSGTAWPAATLNSVGAGALDWHGYSESGGTHTVPTTPAFTEVEDNDSDVSAYCVVASGSYTTSGGASSVSSPNIVSMLHLPEAAGGTAAGTATETDTAQPAGRTRASAAGQSAETDQAQGPGRIRTTTTGAADETDAAIGAGRIRTTDAGVALEADAALAAGRIRSTAAGTATETDQGQPAGRTRVTAAGQAAELDEAVAAGSSGAHPAGQAAELDTALSAGRVRVTAAGTALEADAALSAARTRLTATGTASETDTAQTAARARATATGTALETDTAQPATNPNEILRDLDLRASIEPARFQATIERPKLTTMVEPARFRTEIEA